MMKTACPCLAVLAALFLALTPTATPSVAVAADAPPFRDLSSPYANTAVGAVVDANGGKIPATGLELTKALEKLGDFLQLPITFSAVALHSGLAHPRVVITMRPSSHPPLVNKFFPDGRTQPSSWGGSVPSGSTRLVPGTPIPLGTMESNKPYLEGRLFLAANTELGASGPVVRTVEFISWNSRKLKFDFGVIEGMGGDTPELKVLDGRRCFSCHKNRGPILGVAPWSNTAHNDLVRNTAKPLFKFPHLLDASGKEDLAFGLRQDIDGMTLLRPHAVEVDAAVRQTADMLRDRETLKRLVRTADGRKALIALLSAVVNGRNIEDERQVRFELNQLDLVKFFQDSQAVQKATPPSTLVDYSPAGSLEKAALVRTPQGTITNQVNRYDAARAIGNHGLPSIHQPSNPKAFVRPAVMAPLHAWDVVTPVKVAKAIGLSSNDRQFLAEVIDTSSKSLGSPVLTPAAITKLVITGATFADVIETGILPDRDDFKDRFLAGLIDVAKGRAKEQPFGYINRGTYASTPIHDVAANSENEIAVLPSHACLSCHDIRGVGKPAAFTPIPLLAFDPFDVAAREAWVKATDRKRRVEVLGRFVKRVTTDRDMPPEDSVETEMYRVKDPAGLNAVKDWLDAELKKAKAN